MERKKIWKKSLASVLALSVAFTAVPVPVMADEATSLPEPVYSFDFEDETAGAGKLVGDAGIKDDFNKGKVLNLVDGYMELPQDLFENLGDEGFTIAMWVKADPATGNYTKVFNASNGPLGASYDGHGWSEPDFGLAAGGDVYDLTLYIGEPQTSCTTKSKLKYDTHISRDKWQHMAVSISPEEYSIYFDGEKINYQDAQDGTQPIKEVLPKLFADGYLASLKYAAIGKSYYTSDANFKGVVDDINFFGKALSAEEVDTLYRSYGEIGDEKEPVTMTVDMEQTTGAVKHGATGFLYGVGEDNVPDVNLMTAIKTYMCEQKPAEGLQHPNGDILIMADTFMEAGGDSIQIACPDIYANWPYEFESFEEYMDKLKIMVEQVREAGLSEQAVYVLYNEPEGNWFKPAGASWGLDSAKFNDAWKLAYDTVKAIDANAKVAGPNFCFYQAGHMESYIKYCAENNCIPDQLTWHVLNDSAYNTFKSDVEDIRRLEKKYWLDAGLVDTEREIVINEYADFTQLGVPGQLARWIALFEDAKATGCLAYWHISNNLCDLAASNNEPNGAWWLYKWYAEMSGETLAVSTEGAPQTQFYGLASLDKNKKSAMTVFGGADGTATVTLKNVAKTGAFGDKVKVTLEGTNWTGINGAAEEAFFIKEEVCAVDENGNVTVTVNDMVAAAAYRMTITQADAAATVGVVSEGPWKQTYEGEDAVLGGNARKAGKNGSYACSGTGQAQYIDNPTDSATFKVEVPQDGYYRFDMVYGAATGNNTKTITANNPKNAIQTLSVDGEKKADMYLENTLHWYMSGQHTEYVYLTEGTHDLTVAGTTSEGKATIDCMYLTFVGDEKALYKEQNVKVYEAELSDYNVLGKQTATTVKTENTIAGYSAAGYAVGLHTSVKDGGGIRFTAFANDNGMYELKVRYASNEDSVVNYYVNNTNLTLNRHIDAKKAAATNGTWKEVTSTLFLKKGINIIDIDAKTAGLAVDTLTVERAADQSKTVVIEAEDCALEGNVKIGTNENASGGKYVKEILADKDAKNAITVNYTAPVEGSYEFVVYQSNKELFGSHDYNAQMVDRFITISVNGGEPKNIYFRNTYSDDSFRSQAITLQLKSGTNTIKIYNSDYRVHKNGVGGVNVCTNYTPNLDKFEFTPSVSGATLEDTAKPKPVEPEKKMPKIGTEITVDKAVYIITAVGETEGTVTYKKPLKKTYSKVTIPSTVELEGYTCKVTEISDKAFYKNSKLNTVEIGSNVKSIGKKAFMNAKKLKTIKIKSTQLKKAGKNAFKGIHGKAKISVPSKKYKNYKKLLKKAGVKSTVRFKKSK